MNKNFKKATNMFSIKMTWQLMSVARGICKDGCAGTLRSKLKSVPRNSIEWTQAFDS
jgi:hypothetical protein